MMLTAALPRHTLGCAISPACPERSIVPTALLLHYLAFRYNVLVWFTAISLPVYSLTLIARYGSLPSSCLSAQHAAFEPGQTPFPPLYPVKLRAKQCVFWNAETLASSA